LKVMDRMSESSGGGRGCDSRATKPVNFYCAAPKAHAVNLVGDFNNWNRGSLPMHRQIDGWWFLQVPLCQGHHRYFFLVDDKPILDPRASGVSHDELVGDTSLLAVS
jgi:1,4-alpha-glucan branching enzyme